MDLLAVRRAVWILNIHELIQGFEEKNAYLAISQWVVPRADTDGCMVLGHFLEIDSVKCKYKSK